jgi:very-short-patch-repair endonuclease
VAIGVDGVSHDERLQQDKVRQKEIEKQGVRVLRFYGSDVKTNLNGILLAIADWVRKKEKQQGVRP